MSTNKKFRIQNGVDITGEVVVGGHLVINADGTIVADAIAGVVSATVSSDIAALQAQVDAILGSSPESLDTLQEIVAAFSSVDGDLQTLITNTSAAVTALQTAIGSGSLDTNASTIIGAVNELNASIANIPTGPTGPTGPQGPVGAAGPSAFEIALSAGFIGTEAQWLTSVQGATGATGPQGVAGPTGPKGPTGAQGPVGASGSSAYQIALSAGFTGTESQWLTSVQGATGATGPQGVAGPTGPTGPQGVAGPTGPTGAQGPVGAAGPSAYQIALSAGFTGTESQWLTTVQGATGATGPQGVAGPTGPTGPTGAIGPRGIQGPAGVDGTNGTNGATGPQGARGIDGAVGPRGEIGVPGAPGSQGIQGPAGTNGTNGTNGSNGTSAYQQWLFLNNVGTEADFMASLRGAQGTPGATGPQGVRGTDGAAGPQGVPGAAGATGPQGATGLTGASGANGSDGPSAFRVAQNAGFSGTETQWLATLVGSQGVAGPVGPTGVQGDIGPAGPAGLNWKSAWSSTTNYIKDDAVGNGRRCDTDMVETAEFHIRSSQRNIVMLFPRVFQRLVP